MVKRIELLVHAGAPSSRKDDNRYKAQAEAYHGFEGRKRTLMATGIDPIEPSRASSTQASEHHDETTVIESPTIFLDDTQLAITGLESQLLTSSLPIAPSRAIVRPTRSTSPPNDVSRSFQHAPSDPALEGSISKQDLLAQIRSFGKRKRDKPRHDEAKNSGPGSEQAEVEGTPSSGTRARDDTPSSAAPSLSSYLKTPVLDRSVKKRRQNRDRDKAPVPVLAPFAPSLPAGQQCRSAVGRGTNLGPLLPAGAATAPPAIARSQNSLTVSEPTSELPTSYSLSDITTESSRGRVRLSQRSASDPSPGGGKFASSSDRTASLTPSAGNGDRYFHRQVIKSTSARTTLALPAEINQQVIVIQDDSLPTDEPGAVAPARGTEPSKDNKKAVGTPVVTVAQPPQITKTSAPATATDLQALQILQTLSTSIYPPEPTVSIDAFKTHITRGLADLAANPSMAGRYSPISIGRELRPSERGYWLFDPSYWDLDRQVKFWQFTQTAIGSGSQGWGIWCTREGGAEGLGVVRVYCWGEVVKHVYLLVYVASSSQVRKLGAQWVDAEEEVVVQMRRMQ